MAAPAMSDHETAPPWNKKRLLRMLVACIAAVAVAVVGFNLLYLFVPADKTPPFGFAPDIAAAYARTIPLPTFVFRPKSFTAISLALQAGMWAAFFMALRVATTARRILTVGSADRQLHLSQFLPFIATILGAVIVVARFGERYLLEMAALACLAFVLFVFPVWLPWYLIPTFTLLAVGPFARLNAALVLVDDGVRDVPDGELGIPRAPLIRVSALNRALT
jgi:hypothetical protein